MSETTDNCANQSAGERLKACLRQYPQIFFVLRHRSASGLTRYYDAFCFSDSYVNGLLSKLRVTRWVAEVVDYDMHDKGNGKPHDGTLRVDGGQFSAADAIASEVSSALFGDPYYIRGIVL